MCKCNQNLRYAVMFASFSSKRNFMSFIMYRSRVPAVCRAASILVPAVFAGWNRGPDAKTDTRICLCGALCVYLSPDCGAAVNIRSVGVDARSSRRTLWQCPWRAAKRIGSRNILSYHIVMTGVEVWALAIGLSMDCLAVAVASGVIMERVRWRPMLTMALAFGLFQALNPLIGWLGTNYFRHLIESVDHWIAFAILLFLGGRMVVESFGKEENKHFNPLDTKVILTMALATSIDALAVGISFVCMGMNEVSDLVYPLCVIGFVSFAVTMAGLLFGIKFGGRYARRIKADLWGGIILIAIGVRVLVEHLGGEA